LADKDAKAMIEALAPSLKKAVCTDLPTVDGPQSGQIGDFEARRRAFRADELARACAAAGLPAEAEPDFAAAVARGRELARDSGGVLLVAGSHYLLAPARRALGLCED
jgi:folylpolyglutamate synthase/dihydropteroate synthase